MLELANPLILKDKIFSPNYECNPGRNTVYMTRGEIAESLFLSEVIFILLLVVSLPVLSTQGSETSLLNDVHPFIDWLHHKAHTIIGSNVSLTDYQMIIHVHYGDGVDEGENVYLKGRCRADFSDVRFVASDKMSSLDYWLEKKVDGVSALFWVEVDSIPFSENTTIYIFYGNMEAQTTSDGESTFIFWDDFETDLSKWDLSPSPPILSTDVPFQGANGLKTLRFNNHALANVTGGDTAVRVWFYDQMGGHLEKLMFTGSGLQFAGVGVDEDQSSTGYIIRVGSTYHTTPVVRTVGWHLFEITCFNTSKSFWIDGTLQTPTVNDELDVLKIGSLWTANGENGYFDVVIQRAYCDPEPSHGGWGEEESLLPYIVVDQAVVSSERTDVGSAQSVGFHISWHNNSNAAGEVFVNGTKHFTNGSGWLFFDEVSPTVERKNWSVTGVNCSGITLFIQTALNPSIVWDRIKIVEGGATTESIVVGETVTIWYRAIYEFDEATFSGAMGDLYLNGTQIVWSPSHVRWELNHTASIHGLRVFAVTKVFDSSYDLSVIEDAVGAQTITILGPPTLTASLDSSTALAGYLINISGALTHPDGSGISDTDLTLAYPLTDGESWNDIASATTTAEGEYSVGWTPTPQGIYLIRITWDGDESLFLTEKDVYLTLAATQVEDEHVISAATNSTVSNMAFNSTDRTLSYNVSGPSEAIGYMKITIAKKMIADTNRLKMYLNGNQRNYTLFPEESSHTLYLTYNHNTHNEITVNLGPKPFIPPPLISPLSLSIFTIVLIVATILATYKTLKQEKIRARFDLATIAYHIGA